MDMKVGYKQTDVGVIPEDWGIFRFRDHFTIYAGGDVPKESFSQVKSERHPYAIYANAINNQGLYGFTSIKRSNPGSLTITARGYLGHAEYRTEPFFPIVRLLVLEPLGSLDARYTAYAVNSRVEFPIESTGVPQLTAPQVGRFSIAAPPGVEEQRAIATALSDVDALIGKLDQLIAKKRDLKRAAMQQLLTGKTRLPGFSGRDGMKQGYKQTEVGLVPEDWSLIRVRDLGTVVTGGTPNTSVPDYWDGAYPWVTPTDISGQRDICESQRMISSAGLHAIRPLPANSVLVTCIASIGKNAILRTVGGCNQQINAVVPLATQSAEYLFYMFEAAKGYLLANAGTTATSIVSKGVFERMKFAVPSLSEQRAIAIILSDIDKEIIALEARRDKTHAIKQGMMQVLLTGKVRLPVGTEPTEALA